MKTSRLWIVLSVIACLALCFLLVDVLTPELVGIHPYRYFQVDGIMYMVDDTDQGRKLKHVEDYGQITSTILTVGGPLQDDQANFNCLGSLYTVVDGVMMIQLDGGKWYSCVPLDKK